MTAHAGRAEHVLAALGGPQARAHLDRGHIGHGQLGREAGHPRVRARVAVLGAERLAARAEEAHLDTAGQIGLRQARVGAHSGSVDHLDAVAERSAEAVERRHGVGREDRRAAAAQRARDGGVGPEHGDAPQRAGIERQHTALVAGEHDARRRGAPQLRRDLLARPRPGRHAVDAVERAHPRGEAEQAQHLLVDLGLADAPVAHRRDQRVAPRAAGAGHGEVERGAAGRLGGTRGAPVRHDDAVEAPFVAQDLAQQRRLGHRRAVDAVVGGHDRPGAGLADDRVERGEIELAQRPLVHPRVEREPLGLRVVGHEVLDRRRDALLLQSAHVGGADPRREQRILGQALEVPAARRGAVQVDRGGEQHVHALAPALGGQQPAEALDARLVPRRGEQRRRRHVGRLVALVPALATHAGGAVGRHQPAQARRRLRVQRPEVRAGEQPHLALQRERVHALAQEAVERVDHVGIVASIVGSDVDRARGHPHRRCRDPRRDRRLLHLLRGRPVRGSRPRGGREAAAGRRAAGGRATG
jgi:hypothetical protein